MSKLEKAGSGALGFVTVLGTMVVSALWLAGMVWVGVKVCRWMGWL